MDKQRQLPELSGNRGVRGASRATGIRVSCVSACVFCVNLAGHKSQSSVVFGRHKFWAGWSEWRLRVCVRVCECDCDCDSVCVCVCILRQDRCPTVVACRAKGEYNWIAEKVSLGFKMSPVSLLPSSISPFTHNQRTNEISLYTSSYSANTISTAHNKWYKQGLWRAQIIR